MNSTEVIILALSLAIFGLVFYYLVYYFINKKRDKNIREYFYNVLPQIELIRSKESYYQYSFELNETIYLIKVLPFDLSRELIITNQYFWCINADLKGWKRSTVPDIFPGVKEFVNLKSESGQKIIKMALILPDCHNITRYLNESDVAKVTFKDLVYGVYFVKAVELQLFFDKTK